ncbi:MAG: beta-ketoacyl-[acyl-carrier-protein] synthase family protein [Phycisphaerales bacterium JB065]
MPRRVVITGIGAVTPFGVGMDALWEGLCSGASALGPIESFDATGFRSSLGAEVKDFKGRDFVPKHYRKAVKVMARDTELAVAAAQCAVEAAGLVTKGSASHIDEGTPVTYTPDRVGCQIGAGLIAAEVPELAMAMVTAEEDGEFSYRRWGADEQTGAGMDNLTPLWMLKYLPNMLACHVTIIHDAQGPSNTITCCEASGPLSIGESLRVIERDDADICFSGGVESKLNPMGLLRLDLTGVLAHTEPGIEASSYVRPYDPNATGTLVGEGGGILMVEGLDAAEKRGATPIAEIAGFGAGHAPASDDPKRRAVGLEVAINAALKEAGISPDQVDAIVPQGAGHRRTDETEAAALRAVFDDRLAEIELVTVTPAIGTLAAGAGAIGVCVGARCLQEQKLPARIHAGTPAPDLNAGATASRDAVLNYVLVCTGAIGGQNAAMILKRCA